MDIQFSQHYFLKKLFFPHLNSHCITIGNLLAVDVWVYFWAISPILLAFMSVPYQPHCLNCCSFEIGKDESSIFRFQYCSGSSGALVALHEFENRLFQSFCKKKKKGGAVGILIRIVLNL